MLLLRAPFRCLLFLLLAAAGAGLPVGPAEAAKRPFADIVDSAARRHGVDPGLVHAVIAVESSYRADAQSPAGAQGLMQLMPRTQRHFGVSDAFDPQQNVDAGVAYLRRLTDEFGTTLALAAYNAGPGAVRRHDGIPPSARTRAYVRAVLDQVTEEPVPSRNRTHAISEGAARDNLESLMSDHRTPRRMIGALVCAVACLPTVVLDAEDWPQWRGVDRAAVWRETGIVERFAEDGLIVKWRTPVRAGFAGPAVAGGRVFVLDYRETPGSRTMDGHERLLALDEETGAVLWTREWPATYRNIVPVFATGPRATPTVDGDRVYVLGAAGMLSCFDTASGDLIWRIDTAADYGVTVPVYGVAHSPLVESDLLITLLGGEPDAMVVAFDKATGAEVWRALDTNSEAGYSSPIVTTAGGVRQMIVWHPAGVTSLDPATGSVWWEHDFPIPSGLTIGTPVRSGRYLLITQVENGGLMLALNPDRPAARVVWTGNNPNRTDRPVQRSMTSTPIVVGDAIYGLNSYGELRGVDAATGERLWSSDRLVPEDRWASSHLVRHEDRSFISVETGELVIARFSPAGYEEIDRTHLLTPTTRTRGGGSGRWRHVDRAVLWAHPAYANRHVFARNDAEIVRVSLAAADYE